MCPVLKINPLSGEVLDKSKTKEQILAEEKANLKFYKERKKRLKRNIEKKLKGESEEKVEYKPIVSFNPILDNNNEPSIDELSEPFYKLFKSSILSLKKISKEFNVIKDYSPCGIYSLNKPKAALKVNYDSNLSTYEHIPLSIEYVSNITIPPSKYDIIAYLEEPITKFTVVDRVFFTPLDVKTLLKHPKESKKLIDILIKQMYNNIVEMKFLNKDKKYFGTNVATITFYNYKDQWLEVRMFSDITEVIS
jgi:hypothetical protein